MMKIFKPPVFDDEDKTLNARLLHAIILAVMCTACFALIIAVAIPSTLFRWLLLIGFMMGAGLILMILNNRGHVRLASYLLILAVWAAATAMALTGGGTRSNAMALYLVVVLIAGLLQSGRAGIAIAAFCSLTGLFLVYIEHQEWLPPTHITHTSLTLWLAFTAYMAIVIVLQYLASHAIRDALKKSRQELRSRQEADRALRESEERYRTVVSSTDTGIILQEKSGAILSWNPAAEKMFGISAGSAIGQTWTSRAWKIYRENGAGWPGAEHPAMQTLKTGESCRNVTMQVERDAGDYSWISVNTNPIFKCHKTSPVGVVMTFTDITEQKYADEALQSSKRRLNDLIDFLPDATVAIDLGRKVIVWNRAMEKMTGIKAEDMLGRGDYEYAIPFHGERRPQLMDLVWDNNPELIIRYPDVHRDGNAFIAETFCGALYGGRGALVFAKASPLYDINGNVIGAIESMRDITESRKSEEALRKSENLYRQLFESMAEGFYVADIIRRADGNPEDYAYKEINPVFAHLLGLSREQIIGRRLKEITPHVSEHWVNIFKKVAMTGEPVRAEFYSHSFRKYFKTIAYRPTESEFAVLVEDMTERKQAEDLSRKAEEQIRYITEHIGDAIWQLDADFKFTYISSAVKTILGFDPGEIVGKSLMSILSPDSAKKMQAVWEIRNRWPDPASLGEETTLELEAIHKDGRSVLIEIQSTRILDINKEAVQYNGIARDLTRRRQMEEALQESERRLIQAQAISHTGNWEIDIKKQIITASEEAFRIYGLEYPGNGFPYLPLSVVQGIVHPEDRQEMDNALKLLLEGTRGYDQTFRILRVSDGDERIMHSVAELAYDAQSAAPVKVVGIIQDITEQKKLEKEQKRLEERLQRAEKMEALGTLAGGIAHDLNNVLGIVVGYSEMLMDELDESSPLKDDVIKIMEGAQRSAAIVQDLLTLARRGVQIRQVFNLNDTIRNYQKSPDFEKLTSWNSGIKIITHLDADLLNIMGSPVHLTKTVTNLVANAVEAMPNGGVLTITTRNQSLDQPVKNYDNVNAGDYAVLSVSDTGEGISPEDIKHIFEPFYTKKVMGRSGTGLGLAVVWGTVKDHNGYIDVLSEPGQGTALTLYFPVTRESVKTETAVPVSEYIGNEESILVIDDIKEQRELAAKMLGRLNYRVRTVSSGEEAVAYLKAGQADLLVLDMIMEPGMDGLDTYKAILEIHPQQKAIIVSGFSETDRVKEARSLGVGEYLRKPYIQEKLGLAVRRALDKL